MMFMLLSLVLFNYIREAFPISYVIYKYFSSALLCQVNILYKENYFHIRKEPFSQRNPHNLTPNVGRPFPVLTTTFVF